MSKKSDKPLAASVDGKIASADSAEEDAALRAVARYLDSLGWKVLLIAADSIRAPHHGFLHNYEMVFRFTGRKPAALAGSSTAMDAGSQAEKGAE